MPKPKGPVPSLIGGSNGRPKRVPVLKKSECSRCKGIFVAGDSCVEIPKLGSGYSSSRRVCNDCFQAILVKTTEDFDQIKSI
jgi:hypothetical protein